MNQNMSLKLVRDNGEIVASWDILVYTDGSISYMDDASESFDNSKTDNEKSAVRAIERGLDLD